MGLPGWVVSCGQLDYWLIVQIDMGDMLGIEFILASWTHMAFSLPGGDIVMTVGIWVVVHLQGHSFSLLCSVWAAQEFWAIGADFS